MLKTLEWIGTITGIAGATLVALNIETSGYGFILFLTSSTTWTAAGVILRKPPLLLLNAVFSAINLLGIYRWLI